MGQAVALQRPGPCQGACDALRGPQHPRHRHRRESAEEHRGARVESGRLGTPAMAKWSIIRRHDGDYVVLFREFPGAALQECGSADFAPFVLVREWVAMQARAGDLIESEEGLFVKQYRGSA